MARKTCEDNVEESLKWRLEDLDKLLNGAAHQTLGRLEDYALCFDYVAPDTFKDQEEGYFRYQISWGGPSDEFRFYFDPQTYIFRFEYWFMDWFDGAHRDCTTDATVIRLWFWLAQTSLVEAALHAARH